MDNSYDYPLDATGANTLVFRVNHWWDYQRLGMIGGYYEAALAETADGGDPVGFAWQASVYPSAAAAQRAFADGESRTSQWQDSPTDCQKTLGMPCNIYGYETVSGGGTVYNTFVFNQCVGEVKAWTLDSSVYSSHLDAISQTGATISVVGSRLLKANCTGASSPAPARAQPRPSPTPQPTQPPAPVKTASPSAASTSCATFREQEWDYAQLTANLIALYWNDLQGAYQGNYPGDGTVSPTDSQFSTAFQEMAALERLIQNRGHQMGIAYDVLAVAAHYGVKNPSQPGAAAWVVNRLISTLMSLRQAAADEYAHYSTGMNDYHAAQTYLSNTWDALKQLPCH